MCRNGKDVVVLRTAHGVCLRSVSEGDHQPTRARNEREAEAYRGSRCPRCWGDNEPSWSPSLTLFEVALFIDFRDVRATYWLPSPPRGRGVGGAMLTD